MLKKVLTFNQSRVAYTLAFLWAGLGVAMIAWWLTFGLNKIEEIKQNKAVEIDHLVRQQQMILQEGIFLMGLFVIGGIALGFYIYREEKRKQLLNQFFVSFAHDIKTGLARLNLHIESLKGEDHKTLATLLGDSSRLQLLMENALNFYSPGKVLQDQQEISVSKIVRRLKNHFPDLQIMVSQDTQFLANENSLEIVINNIFHNAIYHGQANEINISVERSNQNKIKIKFEDNGKGFQGDFSKLGHEPLNSRGVRNTGLGLYVVKTLIGQMGGLVEFYAPPSLGEDSLGFGVSILIPGRPT